MKSALISGALLCAGLCGVAHAEDYDVYGRYDRAPRLMVEKLDATRFEVRAPLALYNSGDHTIELNGAAARRSISFQLSPRIDITSAKLRLRHTSSAGLVADKPHLRLDLNDLFLGQVSAMRAPALEADEFDIPVELLHPGYNRLAIGAVQRYTYECQNPKAPELWSLVDARRSELGIVYRRKAFNGTLTDLGRIAMTGIGGLDRLTVVTPGDAPHAAHVKWGALAISAFVNRMDGGIPDIAHAAAADAGALAGEGFANADLVLAGTADELRPLIGEAADEITDAYLSIAPSPADPTRFVLIVSGRTDDEVSRASVYLNTLDRPLPDAAAMTIPLEDMAATTAPSYDPPIAPDEIYRLKDLGFGDVALTGATFGRFETTFLMPADFFVDERANAVLSLDLAYGADLRKDSAVNIFLNGDFQHAIWLSEERGAVVSRYEVRIPARRLKPGRNVLRLDAILTPAEGNACDIRNESHLALNVKETSTISFPQAARFAELPDLKLMAETGFPYFGSDGEPSELRLADARSETLAAAWTLIARLGRITRSSIGDWTVGFGPAETGGHVLYVGAAGALGDVPGAPRLGARYDAALIGRESAFVARKAPGADRLQTALIAATPERLAGNARSLTAFSHWGRLNGVEARWREDADTMLTIDEGPTFTVGALPRRAEIAFLNTRAPWRWAASIGALILALALILGVAARYLRGGDKA